MIIHFSFVRCMLSTEYKHIVYFSPKMLVCLLYRGELSPWGQPLTRKRPGPKFLSALAGCPLQSMCALDRFYCIIACSQMSSINIICWAVFKLAFGNLHSAHSFIWIINIISVDLNMMIFICSKDYKLGTKCFQWLTQVRIICFGDDIIVLLGVIRIFLAYSIELCRINRPRKSTRLGVKFCLSVTSLGSESNLLLPRLGQDSRGGVRTLHAPFMRVRLSCNSRSPGAHLG